jgi:hypothetical protein
MDIFGTAVTSITLLYTFVDGCVSFSHEAGYIALRLKQDLAILQNVHAYFQERLSSDKGQLSDQDEAVLREITDYMQVFLQDVSRQRSKLEARGFHKLYVQMTFAYRQKTFAELETALDRLIQRFDVRLVALPKHLKSVVNLDDSTGPALALQRAVEKYRRMTPEDKAKSTAQPEIWQPQDMREDFLVSGTLYKGTNMKTQSSMLIEKYSGNSYWNYKDAHRELGVVLHLVDPATMGILRCVSRYPMDYSYSQNNAFVYSIPRHLSVQANATLRQRLLDPRNLKHPLNERFTLASKLATALLFVNSVGWVCAHDFHTERPH